MILTSSSAVAKTLCSVLLLLAATISHAAYLSRAASTDKYCGLSIGTGFEKGAFWGNKLTNSLNGVKNINSNTVQFSFYTRQIGINATKATYYSDVRELVHSIKQAKKAGFKVFLKPVVDVKTEDGSYVWRGKISGSDDWFNSLYIPFMTHMARIAKQNNVDILSVGSELRDTEHKTAKWKNVINTIRREYKGQLTYVANHDSYENVKFFKFLDMASISTYFRLVFNPNAKVPDYDQTVKLFKWRAFRIQRWLTNNGLLNKGVLFAEVGFQSKGGLVNYYSPWDWDAKAPVNYGSQVKMYKAFSAVFTEKSWNRGMIFWHWEMNTVDAGGYTPEGKPAENVLRSVFGSFC